MNQSMEPVGETECPTITILPGETTYVYTLVQTYTEAPYSKFAPESGEVDFEVTNTATTITVVMPHTNGVTGELCVFVQ